MEFTGMEPLSKSVTSQKIVFKKQSDGLYKTELSGKYNHIIFPSIVFAIIIGILIGTETITRFGVKNYFGLVVFIFLFGAIIYFIQKIGFKPSCFDFKNKKYHYGNQQELDLNDVLAVQVLTYHHTVSGNYKIRFELNLILLNGERIHLFNNANYQLVCQQAKLISQNLDVEVMDATEG